MHEKMQCDKCNSDQNEVLVLRKSKFTKKGKYWRELHRVCFDCAKFLTKNGHYNLGFYWNGILESLQIAHYYK